MRSWSPIVVQTPTLIGIQSSDFRGSIAVASFGRSHTVPLGARATCALETHSLARLDVRGLAAELGSSPAKVRRAFHSWTGIALRPYHHALRAEAALRGVLASDLKVDALAEDLGYKSKKNMYRTLKTTYGLTPKQIRRLTPDPVSSALTSQRVGVGLRWRVGAGSNDPLTVRTPRQGRPITGP